MSKMDGDLQEMNTDNQSVENEKSLESSKEAKSIHLSDIVDESKEFSMSNKEELISDMKKLMKYPNISEIRDSVEKIEKSFSAFKIVENQQLKDAFIASGEKEEDFAPPIDLLEKDFRDLMQQYHERRKNLRAQKESMQKANLIEKENIIQEIKGYLEGKSFAKNEYDRVRELQTLWGKTGPVPSDKYKEQNERYRFALDQFYDYVRINREFIEVDQKKNEDLKSELCEAVEALAQSEDSVDAFKELQLLHERWKEIGFVRSDVKQPLWDRFSAATSVVNKNYHAYQNGRRVKQNQDIEKKKELTQRITDIITQEFERYKDISAYTDEVVALQKSWKELGIYYMKEDRKLSETFRNGCNMFFAQKRKLQKELKMLYQDVIDRKEAICKEAELLTASEDLESTTARLIELQRDWKGAGNVPPKMSEEIWQRFKKACDSFFDRKKGVQKASVAEEKTHYEQKLSLMELVDTFVSTGDIEEDSAKIRDFIKQWDAIGMVPKNKVVELNKRYHSTLDAALEKVDLNPKEKVLFRFNMRLESMQKSRDREYLLNKERNNLLAKMEKLQGELRTTKNNMGFFASAVDSPLMKEVNDRMDHLQTQLSEFSLQLDRVNALLRE
ncbi:DUF349 domain-containing protein [Halosquirtibacter laminarini]|uniref:DUF349 domain-containing protein n=1 Tax=Halosquirtibacter laminarini TaxID=3374600 RepID=A0AC61NFX7_9BACT|nr:DUF349 domain-containing protein [Prolixibacteraceae bacterium]